MVRIALVGDAGSGKSAFAAYIRDQYFTEAGTATIGVDIITVNLLVNHPSYDQKATVGIWDTAGQERFGPISASFIRGSQCVLIMFDLSRDRDDSRLEHWRNIVAQAEPNALVVLVGTKTDRDKQHWCDESLRKSYTKDLGAYTTILTSAKTGEGIAEALIRAVDRVLELRLQEEAQMTMISKPNDSIRIVADSRAERLKKKKCCS